MVGVVLLGCNASPDVPIDGSLPSGPAADAAAPGSVLYAVAIPPQTGSQITLSIPPTTEGALLLVSLLASGGPSASCAN